MARKQTSPIIAHASAFVLFTGVCACAPDSDQPIEDLRTAPNRLGPDFNGDGYADLVIGVPDDAMVSRSRSSMDSRLGPSMCSTAPLTA